ncbi:MULTISPECIES: hypothetical protein [unclassified Streptomyces]|uniref:hypothetical protein n=1 Tax=unclassified Streptomyces TaxID=2593676 RepID=UPI002DDBEF64|nr:hypothetical protein [Streptomyces sp. NBC_01750]WSB00244.1 hypothetical protein OIE54_13625 [Streptomyces sp. NBC_01794]WSD35421.1 hypothetical protein OG966_28115 [Streptomyces sp. NBC_01750]
MPGDVTPLTTAGGDGTQARRGPRHAAPRKPLLNKLQMPAGKAIALAAMPTAVFLGMGLTPKLALAEDKDIPFAPGPCVTRSDEPAESESPKPSDSATPSGTPSEKPDPSASSSEGDKDEPKPGTTPSASESKPADATAPLTNPTPAPSETQTKNPLDPLGVGDALKDLLDGPDKEPTATATPSATPSASASSKPADEPTAKPSSTPSSKPSTNPVEKVGETADKAKDAIKDAADKAGATTEELDDAVKGLDPKKDEDIPDGAKPRFPCPTSDPKALAAADLEQGIPLLPDDPWILQSSMLTLKGLDYKGIVEVKTGSGKVKKVLKFTASGVDIKDLHQLVVGPNGTTAHVEADKGSTSTITNGTVTMYTEELKGNLFGLIPITFSPETPPPLNVPFAFFTNVKVTQAGQFGGTLKVPGLHNYFTGGKS